MSLILQALKKREFVMSKESQRLINLARIIHLSLLLSGKKIIGYSDETRESKLNKIGKKIYIQYIRKKLNNIIFNNILFNPDYLGGVIIKQQIKRLVS